MRRRSGRNASKSTPTKQEEEVPTRKSRRHSKRHRKSSSSSNADSDKDTIKVKEVTRAQTEEPNENDSHSPKHAQIDKGDSIEQNNSAETVTETVNSDQEDEREGRKGTGKSKHKHRSKGDQTSESRESRDDVRNAEISENVQMSPELNKRDVLNDENAVVESNGDNSRQSEHVDENRDQEEFRGSDDRIANNCAEGVEEVISGDVHENVVAFEGAEAREDQSEGQIYEEQLPQVVKSETTVAAEEDSSQSLPPEEPKGKF